MNTIHVSPSVQNRPDDRILLNLSVSIIAILAVAFWFVLRIGFVDFYAYPVLLSLGVGLFVINFKTGLEKIISIKFSWYWNEAFVLLALMILIGALGYLPVLICKVISILLALAGIASFVLELSELQKQSGRFTKRVWISVYLAIGFGIFVISMVWSSYLNPLFLEMLAMLDDNGNHVNYLGDSLYHMTVAQMLKYNHISSSAVDGTPFLHYHFGSHWLFAKWSSFLNIPVHLSFNICYVVVFVPLFVKSVITLALDIQVARGMTPKISWLGIIALFFIFLRIPDHRYAGGYNSVHMLLSESQVISLLFLMSVGSIALIFFRKFKAKELQKRDAWIFMIAILPILFSLVGLMKISSLFVLCFVAGYIFFRLKLWDAPMIVGLVATAIVSAAIYWLTSETVPYFRDVSSEGGFKFMAFYRGDVLHDRDVYRPFDWFVMFLLWAYFFIIMFFFASRKKNETTLPVEILVAVIVAGLLPSFFLQFFGANNVYFAAIQLYVSCVFIIAYGETFQGYLLSFVKNKGTRIFLFTVCIACVLIIHRRIASSIKNIFRTNNDVRAYYYGSIGVKPRPSKLDLYTYDYAPSLSHHRMYQYIQACCALETSEKEQLGNALVHIDSRDLPRMGSCVEKTFLVPALSGFARVEGMPYDCHIYNYGDQQFEWNYETMNPDPAHFTDQDLCDKVHAKGYANLIRYNVATNSFERIDCRQIRGRVK